jgi:acyl-coenzyme A synthetase/AMP-(fatty) acid ligase
LIHGEEVGAYFETDVLSEKIREKLEQVVRELPLESRPKVILISSQPIPRTHTGKIQRRKLQRIFSEYANAKGSLAIIQI